MKKINLFLVIFAFLFVGVITESCTNDNAVDGSESVNLPDGNENESESGEAVYSTFGSTKSAGMSGNCLSCHYQGGQGEGVFSMGGTVYDSTKTQIYTDATIYLYTEANGTGTLVDSLQTDAYGHFYTTKSIDFSQGLFPVIQGKTGYRNSMPIATTTGACYSCHGTSSTPNIWVK